jgi:arginase family enzyme
MAAISPITLRRAGSDDTGIIVAMPADDPLASRSGASFGWNLSRAASARRCDVDISRSLQRRSGRGLAAAANPVLPFDPVNGR